MKSFAAVMILLIGFCLSALPGNAQHTKLPKGAPMPYEGVATSRKTFEAETQKFARQDSINMVLESRVASDSISMAIMQQDAKRQVQSIMFQNTLIGTKDATIGSLTKQLANLSAVARDEPFRIPTWVAVAGGVVLGTLTTVYISR